MAVASLYKRVISTAPNMESADLILSASNVSSSTNPSVMGELQLLHVARPDQEAFFLALHDATFPLVPNVTTISTLSPSSLEISTEKQRITFNFSSPQDLAAFHDTISSIISTTDLRKQLALIDNQGNVLGVVGSGSSNQFVEDGSLRPPKYQEMPPELSLVPASQAQPVVIEYNQEQQEQKVSLLDTSNGYIQMGANLVCAGIVFGANVLSYGIRAGSNYMIKNSAPAQEPTKVSPAMKSSVNMAHKYSTKAVKISHATVSSVLGAVQSIGKSVGKTVGMDDPKKSQSGLRGLVKNIAVAVDKVGDSLDYGIKKVVGDTKDATGNVVGHKVCLFIGQNAI